MKHVMIVVLLATGMIAARAAGISADNAPETLILCDFEDDNALKAWEYPSGAPKLLAEAATHGQHALEIVFDPKGQYHGAYMTWRRVHRNWSGYDALVLDVLNPNSVPIPAGVLIADQAWADKGRSYWNRHNAQRTLAPGRTQWMIPVRGLYRGEAGSRNNDIRADIDPANIVRLDFGFGQKGASGRIVIDALRLVKTTKPSGIWAFDFGPPDQAAMPGWTPIAHSTAYRREQGYGWGPQGGTPWQGAARDTTFGPPLLRDFCEAGGYNFRIDVPAGRYRFTVFFENSGYWGGEQAQHRARNILAGGKPVWSETRPDGPAHALWRFEDVDPIGADIWATYMEPELAHPVVFEADAGTDGVTLRFEADRVWGSKVAALAAHRADDESAARWLRGQLEQAAAEFRGQAVCLDQPPQTASVPESWKGRSVLAWPVNIEDDVTPATVAPTNLPKPDELVITRAAARGEHEPFCLAIRPLLDLGTCRISCAPWDGPGKLTSDLAVVHYKGVRGFGSIAFSLKPHTLRKRDGVILRKDVTREAVVTARIPPEAPPGIYRSTLTVSDGSGRELVRVALRLEAARAVLSRDTEFLMGFFGIMPPEMLPQDRAADALARTLDMLRDHGLNAVSGGPSWQLKGWRDGQPIIDFAAMDNFVAELKKHGFAKPINSYGGAHLAGASSGYTVGSAGEKVERESGLPYKEALRRCWQTTDRHAREKAWPMLYYCLCDETRVREKAEQELVFMKLMAGISAEFPRTLRTSGAYSVSFNKRPSDMNDLLYWHQRFFESLDASNLNLHDTATMEEARRLGKEIHIYNQGRSRYSFGLYQWNEFRRGVRARWEWHLNVLHGYQFFDLDGREPDPAMICYGRNEIYPTMFFERVREGCEDFYLYETLRNLVERRKKAGVSTPALGQAESLMERLESMGQLNQRTPPAGFDADALKAEALRAIERLETAQGGK